MKKYKAELSLTNRDIETIKNVLVNKCEVLPGSILVQCMANLKEETYILLELWVTDEGTNTPILTLSLNNTDNEVIDSMDIENIIAEDIDNLFNVHILEGEEEVYEIKIIELEQHNEYNCDENKEIKKTLESYKKEVEILKQTIIVKDNVIYNYELKIEELKSEIKKYQDIIDKINMVIER